MSGPAVRTDDGKRLVMLLLAHNEADIVGEVVSWHLDRGVSHVVCTDNASTDGTVERLRPFVEAGKLTLLHEPSPEYRQDAWLTRMAVLARDRLGADWLLATDADEFCTIPSGDIGDVLPNADDPKAPGRLVCRRVNMVGARDAVGRGHWSRSLTYRASTPPPMPALDRPMTDPLPVPFFYYDLPPKMILRAAGLLRIHRGAHDATYEGDPPDLSETPIRIYHYPVRSRDEFAHSVLRIGSAVAADPSLASGISWKYRRWSRLTEAAGSILPAFREAMPGRARVAADVAAGTITEDTTMRDALNVPTEAPEPDGIDGDVDPAMAAGSLIVIAGMHRSGTSALAAALGMRGAPLPSDMLTGNSFNVNGYFEPKRITETHDAILTELGLRWDDIGPVPRNWLDGDDAAAQRDILFRVLIEEYVDLNGAVLKDPRICRLLPLWRQMARDRSLNLTVVIPLRNPLEVAKSLADRDGLPVAHGLLLWLQYSLDAEVASRGMRRIFLRYEALLDDWRSQIDRIEAVAHATWPKRHGKSAADIAAFLSDSMRHHTVTDDALMASPAVPDSVKTVYEALGALAEGAPDQNVRRDLDEAAEALRTSSTLLGASLAAFKAQAEVPGDRLASVRGAYERKLAALGRSPAPRKAPMPSSPEPATRGSDGANLEARLADAKADAARKAEGWRRANAAAEDLQGRLSRATVALDVARSVPKPHPPRRRIPGLKPKGHLADISEIASCPEFDGEWYLGRFPDVAKAGMTAAEHYYYHGASECRPAGPEFDTLAYYRAYPKVMEAGYNAILHYARTGRSEGFKPSAPPTEGHSADR